VVGRHKGSLQVRSKSGAGTVFRLFLPFLPYES
jgi:signal transduction histidine kinase